MNGLPIQIVATLENKQELAQFLNAHLYERNSSSRIERIRQN